MTNCPNCEQSITSASDDFCVHCGASLRSSSTGVVLERETPPADEFAEPLPQYSQLPPTVVQQDPRQAPFRLAYDETILKTYEAVVVRTLIFKRIRGWGTLYVTDARVVFHAIVNPRGTMRASRLVQQTKLEDISGLSVSVQRRLSLLLIVLTAFFTLGFIGALLSHNGGGAVVSLIVAGVFGFLLVADARNRGKVAVTIKSRENDNSPIGFGYGARLSGRSAYDLLRGKPGRDADLLVHELGALILDLQTRGTTAYDHWGITGPVDRERVATAL